jgi:glycogen phosphorylase
MSMKSSKVSSVNSNLREITPEEFKERLASKLDRHFEESIEEASKEDIFAALASMVRDGYSSKWRRTRIAESANGHKQAYYFSIEFLPGTLLRSNLLNLGWLDTAKEAWLT